MHGLGLAGQGCQHAQHVHTPRSTAPSFIRAQRAEAEIASGRQLAGAKVDALAQAAKLMAHNRHRIHLVPVGVLAAYPLLQGSLLALNAESDLVVEAPQVGLPAD